MYMIRVPCFPDAISVTFVNTMYIPQDVDDENGGTLIIPGLQTVDGSGDMERIAVCLDPSS